MSILEELVIVKSSISPKLLILLVGLKAVDSVLNIEVGSKAILLEPLINHQ